MNENEKYYLQAMKVDFLTERWEIDWYANALMEADEWGKKTEAKKKENTVRQLAWRYNKQ